MALLVCTNDLVLHAVGSPACPQCGETRRVEEGSAEHEALLRDAGQLSIEDVPDEAGDATVPAGSADDVLAWVGDDPVRARRALDVELATASPRSTLTAKLEKLAG